MQLQDATYPNNPAVAQAAQEERCAIENEANALRSQLSAADRDKTRLILDRLRMLTSRVMPNGRTSRRTCSILADAIAQAQMQLNDLSWEDIRIRNDYGYSARLEAHIYASMSAPAQQFYNAIDNSASYTITPVAHDGQGIVTAQKQIEGRQLRRLFSVVKYHTMSEQQKKDVLGKTFGTDAVDDDKPKDRARLQSEKDDLQHLHQALRDMEAYKATIILTNAPGNIEGAMAKISANHEVFARAHAQVDDVMSMYNALLEHPDDPVALAALKYARFQLRQLLRDEVVNKVLLEVAQPPNAISGGVGVATIVSGLLRPPTAERAASPVN